MEKLKSYTHKVQYYETDAMAIVHHSNYIRWFEEARLDYLEQIGLPYDEIERRLMEIEESSDEDIYEMKPIRSGTIHIQRQNKKGFLDKLKEILGLN